MDHFYTLFLQKRKLFCINFTWILKSSYIGSLNVYLGIDIKYEKGSEQGIESIKTKLQLRMPYISVLKSKTHIYIHECIIMLKYKLIVHHWRILGS